MSFFGRVFSSLKETSEQRISNPIYGAFILSWVAFNWKAIAIFLFSERGIYLKIDDIATVTDINSLLINPAKMALAALIVVPAINALYAVFTVVIKAFHKFSNVYDSYFNSWFALREERLSARISVEKELTIAKERTSIAEENLKEEQLKLETALTKHKVDSVKALEDNFQTISNNLNIATQANSRLAAENNDFSKKINDLLELNKQIDNLNFQLKNEKRGHEKTKTELAKANSQNRTLYLEKQELSYGMNPKNTPPQTTVIGVGDAIGRAIRKKD